MSAQEWAMANKVKTAGGVIVVLVSLMGSGFAVKAWAEDMSEEQVRESEIRQEARSDVIYGTIRNKHAYDFYGQEAEDAEEDLVELEQQVAEGVVLLPSQVRKMKKLEEDIANFEEKQAEALNRLSNPEADDATE